MNKINFQFITSIGNLIKINRKLSLFLASMIISISFFIIKDSFQKLTGIDYTNISGQLNKQGIYDFGDYTGQVNHLIYSGNLVDNDKILNRYPPGYPFLLYTSFIVSKYLHINLYYSLFILAALFIAFSSVIIGEIAYLLYKSNLLAISAGLLYTTHPYVLQGLSKIMPETPFMAFLYFSLLVYFFFITKNPTSFIYPIVIGFFLGIAMLIRPIGLFLPIVLSILTFFYLKNVVVIKRFLISAIILISSIITILPWQIYNYKHSQMILLSSDEVASIIDGVSFNNHSSKMQLNLPSDVDSLSRYLSTSGATTRPDFFKIVYQEFTGQPIPMCKLIFIKAARSWYGAFGQEAKKERIKLIILGVYATLTLFALIKFKFNQRARLIIGITSLVLVLYFWAMTILVVSMVRYMYPIFGLAVIFIPALISKKINV